MRHCLVANWNPVLVLHDQHSCRSHLNTARRQLANADKILVHIIHNDSLLKSLQSRSPTYINKSSNARVLTSSRYLYSSAWQHFP